MILAIIAATLLVGVVAAVVTPIRFDAEAQLLVLFSPEQAGSSGLTNQPAVLSIEGVRATGSEVEFLRGRALMHDAVERVGPARIVPGLNDRRLFGLLAPIPEADRVEAAVDQAQRSLKVSAQDGSNLVVLSFAHRDRAIALQLLNTLIDIYLTRRAEVFSTLRSPALHARAELYAGQLDQIEDQIKAAKAKYNILNIDQDTSLALTAIDNTKLHQQQLTERHEALGAEIATTIKQRAALPPRVFDFQEENDHKENDDTGNMLAKLYLERDALKRHYQDSEPRLQDVEKQIGLLEEMQRKPHPASTISREVRNPAFDFLDNHLLQVSIENDSVEHSLDQVNRELVTEQNRIDQLREAQRVLADLDRSRTVVEQLYREANQRAEAASLDEAAQLHASNVRIVERAVAPLKGRSESVNILLASLVGGVAIALAIALAAAWNRRVYLLPQEVERDLSMPVLATIGDSERFDGPAAQAQIIYLANRLAADRGDGKPIRWLQIISADNEEYRAEVARAIAVELAQGQGRRTLLLDLTGDGNRQRGALGGDQTRRTIGDELHVAATRTRGLDVSIGATSVEPTWLRADSETFNRLFRALAADYDIVVIEAPPASEGLLGMRLASVVDGSVMVVRAEHTRTPVAENLRNQLLRSGGDLFGAIMTGRKFYIPEAIYRWF